MTDFDFDFFLLVEKRKKKLFLNSKSRIGENEESGDPETDWKAETRETGF